MKPATTLPLDPKLPQQAVQEHLQSIFDASGESLDETLQELEQWSHAVGYFDHLTEENEFLSFANRDLRVTLRLQVNYSRLGYRAPEPGEKRPACPLCIENIGVAGKELLRVFEFTLEGTRFFAHLTPFPLHPGHFVMNSLRHEPMRVGEESLRETAAFLDRAPGWLAASNSDVEWAGASVLGHHHCQLFRELQLPLEDAAPVESATISGVQVSFLNWPTPVYRIEGASKDVLRAGSDLLQLWKDTAPGKATANFLLRHPEEDIERLCLHLLPRHPDYRTPEALRTLKSEGVGIIEVAGEVILPPLPGKSREENREAFERIGPWFVPALIRGNAPFDERLNDSFYWNLARQLS